MIYHMLFHVRADDTAASHLNLNGLSQDPTSQRLHGPREGGRKHDCLTVWTHVVHDTHHLVEEKDDTWRSVNLSLCYSVLLCSMKSKVTEETAAVQLPCEK